MKKQILIFIALAVIAACILASCANNTDDDENADYEIVTDENGEAVTDEDGNIVTSMVVDSTGLEDTDTEFGYETKEVTDENGDTVTTLVPVIYKTDDDGNTYAVEIDSDGETVTDKNGEAVTIAVTSDDSTTTAKKSSSDKTTTKKSSSTVLTTESEDNDTTGTTKKDVELTSTDDTTKADDSEDVPQTDDKGVEVTFSLEDQEIIASMLEVPKLYLASYENEDGVPITIATHTAIWMTARSGNTGTTYPSSQIVLDLFKYFGQTVVNFKTQCNTAAEEADAPISYVKSNDTFTITEFEKKDQTVQITKIEDLQTNNYYKVTAKVSNCSKTKVVAIVQKNKLDSSLGFSIKALQWS